MFCCAELALNLSFPEIQGAQLFSKSLRALNFFFSSLILSVLAVINMLQAKLCLRPGESFVYPSILTVRHSAGKEAHI